MNPTLNASVNQPETLEVESRLVQITRNGQGDKVKEYLVEVKGRKSHHVKVTCRKSLDNSMHFWAIDVDLPNIGDMEVFGMSSISEVEAIRDMLDTIYN
jgi:hypothetical protein